MLVAIYRKILRRNKQGKAPRCDALLGALVRVTRLERAISASQMRRGTNSATPGYSISAMIPRRAVKIKLFLSVVIPVVKGDFVPFSATGEKPAIARAARLCELLSKPRMDRVYALPNQARYQLRYTRIFNFCHDTMASGKNKDFSVCGHSCGQSRFYAVFNDWGKSRKCRCHKAFRRFALLYPGYRHGTPKPHILSTEPYLNACSFYQTFESDAREKYAANAENSNHQTFCAQF